MSSSPPVDPRRVDKIRSYKSSQNNGQTEDFLPDYFNILGMIFSMCGLMMKLKWCAWLALYCSCISFANSRATDDAKQVIAEIRITARKINPVNNRFELLGFVIIYVERFCRCHVIYAKSIANDTPMGYLR